MPWLTIIMAVLTFFMSGGAKKENRSKALLAAGAVGLGTYAVTHYTDWGAENLGSLDGVTTTTAEDGTVTRTNADGTTSTIKAPTGSTPANNSTAGAGSSGFWSGLTGWLTSPAGQITTGAAGASAVMGGIPKWVLWGGIAVGAYLLLKD